MDAATAQRSHTGSVGTLHEPAPATFRGYLRANPHAAVTWGALAIVMCTVALRGWAAARGWFFYDDLAWQGVAASYDRPGLELLLTPWNGHLMPGGWLVVWVFTTLAPLQYWPIVVSALLLQAAIGWMLFLVLRRLFGSRVEILALLVIGLLSTLSLQAGLWWAVGLAQLPLLLAGLVAIWAHLGHLRHGRLRDVALVVLALVAGLAFSERTLLVLPLLFLLTLGWFAGQGRPLALLRRALLPHWALWLAVTVVSLAFVAYYVTQVPSAASPGGNADLFRDVLTQAVGYALLPALAGGPWQWLNVDDAASTPDPGLFLRAASALVFGAIVAWTCLALRRAPRAWALLLAYLLVGAVMLTLTRAAVYGAGIGREYRFFTELVLVAPLAIGLATMPVRWPSRTGTVTLAPRRLPAAVQARLEPWRPVAEAAGRHRASLVAAFCALFVLSSGFSTVRHDENWHSSSSRDYLRTVRAELLADPQARLVDTYVPRRVVDPIQGKEAFLSHVLRPVTDPGLFLTSGTAGDELRMLDDDGRLQQVAVDGQRGDDGPVPGCGWLVTAEPLTLPLEGATPDGRALMALAYFTDQDVTASVEAGGTRTDVLFREGLHVLYAPVEGPVRRVAVELRSAEVDVCLTSVQIGQPSPVPAG